MLSVITIAFKLSAKEWNANKKENIKMETLVSAR
jgi:hypothetical protein